MSILQVIWQLNLRMLKFFKDIKDRLSKDQQEPVYRQYSAGQLKMIAMKTRMVFEQIYRKQSVRISQGDFQFKKVQAEKGTIKQQYQILQQIGRKVIQVQSLKLYMQILRKIQSYSQQIINTRGDVSLLKQQIKWFQCVLWYRRCKNVKSMEEFNSFCYNFFKGVDITMELNLKCEIFKLYQGMEYLNDDYIIPLDYTIEKVIPYVSFKIDQEELDEMKVINNQEMKKKQEQQNKIKNIQNPVLPINNISNSNQIPYQNQYNNINNPMYNNNISSINNPINNPIHNLTNNSINNPINNPNNINNKSVPFPVIDNKNTQHYHSVNQYTKPHLHDDQFAIDPYSKFKTNQDNSHTINYSNSHTNNQNNNFHKINQNNSPTINPNKNYSNKTFKSQNLNLVDWQSSLKQQNPYVNNSKIALISPQYSIGSSENQYDQKTLPYPPSGVVPVDQVNEKNQYYFDTLDNYEPVPVKNPMKFIKKQPYTNQNNMNIKNDYQSKIQNNNQRLSKQHKVKQFDEQDLIKQIQNNKSNKSSSNQVINNKGVQQKKSLNKLFGFKFKSNLNNQNNQPKHQQYNYLNNNSQYNKINDKHIKINDYKNEQNNKQNQISIIDKKQQDYNQIDDILANLQQNKTQKQYLQQKQQQQQLNNILRESYANQKQLDSIINRINLNQPNQCQDQLDELYCQNNTFNKNNKKYPVKFNKHNKKNQNIDQDIKSLIQTKKKQLINNNTQQQQFKQSKMFHNNKLQNNKLQNNRLQHNKVIQQHNSLKQNQNKQQNDDWISLEYSNIDNERFNDSIIKLGQGMQLPNNKHYNKSNQQISLSFDKSKQSLQQLQSKQISHTNNQINKPISNHNYNPVNNQTNSQINNNIYDQHQEHPNYDKIDNLDYDMIDSIKIIKSHFGLSLSSKLLQYQQHLQQQLSLDQNNALNSNPIQNIKKPYMVSIYARKQYLQTPKLNKFYSNNH